MNGRIVLTIALVVLSLAVGLVVQAQQVDGKTALKNMLEAEKKVSFIAHEVTTLARGPAVTSEQTVYRAGIRGMRMEYLSPPKLRGEIRVDDGHVLMHYIPEKKLIRMHPSRLAGMRPWMQHTGCMIGHHEHEGGLNVQVVGSDKIAGRSAYVVEIKPGDHPGPRRKLWIDTEKWIKLKTEEIAPDGTVVSMSYFTKIDFVNNIPDSKFHIDTPPGVRIDRDEHEPRPMPVDRARREAGFHLLEPTYLPQGFRVAGAVMIPFRDGKIVGLRYTDGVTTVSLFQTPGDKLNPRFIERLQHGPARSGTGVYTWREGSISLTIVGRISQDEIRKIAGSVK